jgi:thiazole synthase ThiGH ThiG subunit
MVGQQRPVRSPSVDTIASSGCSAAHAFASAISSGRTASVSTGMKLSARPSGTASAPSASTIRVTISRPTAEC